MDEISSQNIPQAPIDPTTSDKAWNAMRSQVNQLTNKFILSGGDSHATIRDIFLGYITFSPPDGQDDFTNARYWVIRCEPVTEKADDQLVVDASPVRNMGLFDPYVPATNLAELYPQTVTSGNPTDGGDGTHLLDENQPVIVYVFTNQSTPFKRYYVFNLTPFTGVVFKLISVALKPGTYGVKIWTAPKNTNFDPTSSSNLTEADFGTAGPDAWAINSREIGLTGHILDTSSFLPLLFTGTMIGSANDNSPLIAFNSDQSEACQST